MKFDFQHPLVALEAVAKPTTERLTAPDMVGSATHPFRFWVIFVVQKGEHVINMSAAVPC